MSKNILKIIAVVVVISGAVFGIYYYNSRNSAASAQQEEFKEVAARQGDVKIKFLADGKAYLPVLRLRFLVNGQVKEVLHDIGDKVKKEDVIAKIEDKEYVNKLESSKIGYDTAVTKLAKTKQQYESQLISEKSKLDNLKFQLDSIQLQYDPMLKIPEGYSRQEIESKRLSYENAKASYESALRAYNLLLKSSEDIKLDEINIQQAKTAVKIAEDNLNDTILKSPVDGEILSISNRPGEIVSSSSSSTSSNTNDFAIVSDSKRLSVTAQVSELDLTKIEKGQAADIEFEALQGQSFSGQVLSVDPLPVTDSSGIVTYTVNIEIGNISDKIKDGMTCNVSFILKQKQNVVVIPNVAVKMVEGKQVVEVKDESGNVVIKNIKTGLTDGTNVEVIEGLKAGDKILTRVKK